MTNSTEEKDAFVSKTDEETCPVCQEKLGNQRMVFQCGHVTCCKCKYYYIILLNFIIIFSCVRDVTKSFIPKSLPNNISF